MPRVILHTAITADGRTDSPAMDVELYYELASRWPADCILIGSETMIAATPDAPPEDEAILRPRPVDPADQRPWIAVVDSQGRFRHWHVLVTWPYMRGVLALVASGAQRRPRDAAPSAGRRRARARAGRAGCRSS